MRRALRSVAVVLSPRGYSKETGRGDAAAATWIFKVAATPRPRRGYSKGSRRGYSVETSITPQVRAEIENLRLEEQGCGARPWDGGKRLVSIFDAMGFSRIETDDGKPADAQRLEETLFSSSIQCRRGSCDFVAWRADRVRRPLGHRPLEEGAFVRV